MVTTSLNDVMLKVIGQYRLSIEGTHGMSHWSRVLRIGRYLAPLTGADVEICDLFALLHDSQRVTEAFDELHGKRGANYVKSLGFDLPKRRLDNLIYAIKWHNEGKTFADNVTVMTCWDMDRLDLGRVGTRPDPKKLCTDAAKLFNVIDWSYSASIHNTLGPNGEILIPETEKRKKY